MDLIKQEYKKALDKKLFLSCIQVLACNPTFAPQITDFQDVMNFIFKKQGDSR